MSGDTTKPPIQGPKTLSFDDVQPEQATPKTDDAPKTAQAAERPAPLFGGEKFSYTNRFNTQKYHPVVLIGSENAGKTVLILSLLAYLKSNPNGKPIATFFGNDLFPPAGDKTLEATARRYFDVSVAQFMAGRSEANTKIDTPMFIPALVSGDDGRELRFAFMESDGEKYKPDWDRGDSRYPEFNNELEKILRQYAEGISFIWVLPRAAKKMSSSAIEFDSEKTIRESGQSVLGAIGNYKELRGDNSARDTHMLLVSQWDTHVSDTSPADVYQKLDRANDSESAREVDQFLKARYAPAYASFRAINCPLQNKTIFRFSAGRFDTRDRNEGDLREILLTYPRDIWNWLYDGMRMGHDWNLDSGPLFPKPAPPQITLWDRIQKIVRTLIG
jgi:hypothetical protein